MDGKRAFLHVFGIKNGVCGGGWKGYSHMHGEWNFVFRWEEGGGEKPRKTAKNYEKPERLDVKDQCKGFAFA